MNGNVSLLVEAGKLWNGKEWLPQPLPYGTRPRLALVHVSSEAVRTKSPTVEVGHSTREFLLRLGIGTGGEEYANFNRQLRALAACRMSLTEGDELESERLKARLGEMLLERELLEAKIAALESGRPLARRRSRP